MKNIIQKNINKKVVIIGGGFAGSTIAKKLEHKFDVTLIDSKNYFEFTPSVLRTLVEPSHIKKIQRLHSHYLHRTNIVMGHVSNVDEEKVYVGQDAYEYDYLAICSGSRYELPLKEQDVIMATRAEHLRNSHKELKKAKSVLIIGGGIAGVELAGEVIEHYPEKEVMLAHSRGSLMPRSHETGIKYAGKELLKMGVKLLLNQKVQDKKGKNIKTDKGDYKADIVFLCTGIRPNFEFLKKHFSGILSPRNQIEVNVHLQVKGWRNVFAAGDITAIDEEKLAQGAEHQGTIVANNICSLEKNHELKEYIPKARPMLISIGKRKGILVYKNHCYTGLIPAIMKSFVEFKEMLKY